MHHVTVGNDEAVWGKNETRAAATMRGLSGSALLLYVNLHHGAAHALGHRGHGAGVVIQQMAIIRAGMKRRVFRETG